MSLYSECYRLAEAAHQGVDDAYLRAEAASVAAQPEIAQSAAQIYREAQRIFIAEFEA